MRNLLSRSGLQVLALTSLALTSSLGVGGTVGTAQELPVSFVIQAPIDDVSKPNADTLTLVLGGDLGFGGSGQPVVPSAALRHGTRIAFPDFTAGLRPLLTGDINFANLETVITDRNDLTPLVKAFTFRSHPSAVRHIVDLGMNALSMANNHAVDYGDAGLRETLRHLSVLREAGLQAAPGVGLGRAAALAPAEATVRGFKVRVSAIGIGAGYMGQRAADERPVMASYGSAADLQEMTSALAAADGDVRLLSVHYGIEMQVRPSAVDQRRLRDAANAGNVDIVAGHHAHVAAGVQDDNGRFLFYGLGNLLHPGMQDMARYGICRDYGVLARVHMQRAAGERFKVRAVEIVTLADMHLATRARTGADGRLRIAVLNHLAAGLDGTDAATRGVRFAPREDGTGLWCAPGATDDTGAVGRMCSAQLTPTATDESEQRRIAVNCGAETVARHRPDPAAPQRAITVAHSRAVQPDRSLWRQSLMAADLR